VKKRRRQKLDRIRRGLVPSSSRHPRKCKDSDVSTTDEDGNSVPSGVKESSIDYIETPMASPLAATLICANSLATPVMFHDELDTVRAGGTSSRGERVAPFKVGLDAHVNRETPSSPQPTPMSASPFPGRPLLDMSTLKVFVKNTFLDVETEYEPHEMQRTKSCIARFSTLQPGHHPSPRKLAAGASAGADTQKAPPGSIDMQASIGSRMHGTVTADGQPGCQPCAWFRKPSGCSKGVACKYCHLCPLGEVKKRRRQKLDRIRRGLVAP